MVRLRNVNPLGHVDVPALGRTAGQNPATGDAVLDDGEGVGCLKPGEVFEVDAETAGQAPRGSVENGDYDLGSGLLAQVGNYELADAPKVPKQSNPTPTGENTEI